MKKLLILSATLLSVLVSHAQAVTPDAGTQVTGNGNTGTLLIVAIWVVISISILVLIVAIYALAVLKTIVLSEKRHEEGAAIISQPAEPGWFGKLTKNMTDAVPVDQEASVLLDHNYDGIRELDNHLPPWWKWLFIFSIGWAAVYLLVFHVFNIFPLSGEEYNLQVARAEADMKIRKVSLAASVDETNITFSNDPAIIESGKEIFAKNCIPCHAADGGGGVGPNLTDKYWIHGGGIGDIFRTIKYGVPDKGMITWQSQLTPPEMRDVACFVHTLEGTAPARPKEPQGDLYQQTDTVSLQADTTLVNKAGPSADSVKIK